MFKKMLGAFFPAAALDGASAAKPAGEGIVAQRANNAGHARDASGNAWGRMEESSMLSPYNQSGDRTFSYSPIFLSPLALR